ncbi:hypothetical protein chiPu_0023305 [Chiloscyllium punctatum]|uniref:Uncharacterized protein n=1 Tax=Chiloscyllium punctatum TaxID=137246 RepID=A0A401T7X3_CHIPU|nr:hypothetical protein [Chiloscyllium punctatum]
MLTWTSCLTPSWSVSLQVVYEAGLSLRNVFLFISCLSSIHIARTYVLLPRSHIPYPLPDGYTYGTSEQREAGAGRR